MSRPVVIVFSVLAGLQVLTAGSVLTDVTSPKTAASVGLLVAAVQAGMAFYVQSQVTPNQRVAARETPTGTLIAGEAGPVDEGTKVDVTEAAKTTWT